MDQSAERTGPFILVVLINVRLQAMKHGQGELLFSNGDHYTGDWEVDRACGQVRPSLLLCFSQA